MTSKKATSCSVRTPLSEEPGWHAGCAGEFATASTILGTAMGKILL